MWRKKKKEVKEVPKIVSQANKVVEDAPQKQDFLEKLEEMNPSSEEEFLAWLPEEVSEMQRMNFRASAVDSPPITFDFTYALDDQSQEVEAQVVDGAGSYLGATSVVGYKMILDQDTDKENDYGFTRTVIRDGNRATEGENSAGGLSTVFHLLSRIVLRQTSRDTACIWKNFGRLLMI